LVLLCVRYFLRDGVKAPLGIGDVLLEDGSQIKGFIGESYGVVGAPEISEHGGWKAYLKAKEQQQ
jgi:allophanate hydrolase